MGARIAGRGGRWGVVLALVCALVSVAVAGLSGGATAHASARASETTVPDVLAGLASARSLGPAPADTKLTVGFGVRRPDASGEKTLDAELYDPSSPLYHHFLTPRQFDARFGVTAATVSALRAWITRAGLKVAYADGSHDYWSVTGTAAQVEAWLHVSIDDYVAGTTRFYANRVSPAVPADLPILGITGLNDYPSDHTAQMLPRRRTAARADRVTPHSVVDGPGSGVQTIYSPQDLWKIYDYPDVSSLINADGTSTPATLEASKVPLGQGQTAGIVASGDAGAEIDQLRLFEQHWGLPKVPVKVIEVAGGADSTYDAGGDASSEWSLDVQAITGMAPDLKQLIIYDAPTLDQGEWFSYWADQTGGAEELNSSEFSCEDVTAALDVGTGETDPSITVEEPLLEKATMEGRTLFNASGDTGSGCEGLNGVTISPNPSVGYPCSSDYVTCVGGTVLSSEGTSYPESTEDVTEDSWTYGGGGSSDYVPEPSFQDPVTAISSDCVLDLTTDEPYDPPTVCRAIPDVADFSANLDGDGYFVYLDGEPTAEGGTSLSSPLMAGQWASIQSAATGAVQSAGGLGFADATFYKQAAGADGCDTGDLTTAEAATVGAAACTNATYNRDFTDITQGEDAGDSTGLVGDPISTGVGTSDGEYFPTPGWDYVTGWGSLKVANMEQDVDGDTTATDAYTGTEVAPTDVSQATLQSYPGAASDEVNLVGSIATDEDMDDGINVTQATLSATASTVTATLTIPDVSDGTPADVSGSVQFYVAWLYDGTVYYLNAAESPNPEGAEGAAAFTYTSGETEQEPLSLTAGSGFENTASTKAVGSLNLTTGVMTITAPASEVGSPANCALLAVPQAFVVTQGPAGEGVPEVTGNVEDINQFDGYSTDGGAAESVGEDVQVGGTSQTCAATSPATPTKVTTVTPTKRTVVTKATLSQRAVGKGVEVTAKLPAAAKSFYFRWEIGVSFGRRAITVKALERRILSEIAVYAEPSDRRLRLRITRLSRLRGQIHFVTIQKAPSDFTFRLDSGAVWLSPRIRAYLTAHHTKTVSGVFEVRTVKGTTYRVRVKVKL
jgi:hypothetical protein